MKIAISATNPCHLWDMAKALSAMGALACYYSGYPRWRLDVPDGLLLRTKSGKTIVTYLLNRLPPKLRPSMLRTFRWQDAGFDRWVASSLRPADFIHAMPGQSLQTFRKARDSGTATVLNHASGPLWRQNAIVAEEYRRAGLPPPAEDPSMRELEEIHRSEYGLADIHCVASRVVNEQLRAEGIEAGRIWTVPYSADERIFYPGERAPEFRAVFAGQLVLRKGLRTLLQALESIADTGITLDCFGHRAEETIADILCYRGRSEVIYHGAVARERLADAFRAASVLILPSYEEAFGLVVPQALACGCPCIVSDRTGAADLIVHRKNGSIFPAGDATALAEEILWWRNHPASVGLEWSWADAARTLLELSNRYAG